MAKTLILEKRGCDYMGNDIGKDNVGNYRVGVYSYQIQGKDGNLYSIEFGCFDRYTYRTTNKRTGKPLKKSVRELVLKNALHIDTQFEKPDRSCWRNSKLEEQIHDELLTYSLENILKVVNEISVDTYTNIEFR